MPIRNITITAESRAYFRSIRHMFAGRRGFVIGNGPSLRIDDLTALQGEITIACNKIFLAFDKTPWRPSFYSVADPLLWPKIAPGLHLHVPTVHLSDYLDSELTTCSTRVWQTLGAAGQRGDQVPDFSYDLSRGIWNGFSITYENLQLAVHLGLNPIYILGCDHYYAGEANVQPDKPIAAGEFQNHFIPNYRSPGELVNPAPVELMNRAMRHARDFALETGIQIVNATRGGHLDFFPREDFDKILRSPAITVTHPPETVPDTGTSTTVVLFTGAADSSRTQKCLRRIKTHTSHYHLRIVEHADGLHQNMAKLINQTLRSAETDRIAFLDDTVSVTPGWLTALHASMQPDTAIVCPTTTLCPKSTNAPDNGHSEARRTNEHRAAIIPAAPGICMLIDRTRLPSLRANEALTRGFLELDLSLQAWEAGFRIRSTPMARVSPAPLQDEPCQPAQSAHTRDDLSIFHTIWISTGKLQSIARARWDSEPVLRPFARLAQTLTECSPGSAGHKPIPPDCLDDMLELAIHVSPYPHLKALLADLLLKSLDECRQRAATADHRKTIQSLVPLFAQQDPCWPATHFLRLQLAEAWQTARDHQWNRCTYVFPAEDAGLIRELPRMHPASLTGDMQVLTTSDDIPGAVGAFQPDAVLILDASPRATGLSCLPVTIPLFRKTAQIISENEANCAIIHVHDRFYAYPLVYGGLTPDNCDSGFLPSMEQQGRAVSFPSLSDTRNAIRRMALLALHRFHSHAKQQGWHRILLYGAGKYTNALLPLLSESQADVAIIGVVDDHPSAPSMAGIPLWSPHTLPGVPFDAILVSAPACEEMLIQKASQWAPPRTPITGWKAMRATITPEIMRQPPAESLPAQARGDTHVAP